MENLNLKSFTHIFVITKGNEIGGASYYIYNLCKYLINSNYSPLVVHGPRGEFSKLCSKSNIPTLEIPNLKNNGNLKSDLIVIIKLIDLFSKLKKRAIINLNSSKASFLGRIASFISKRHCIHTVHGWAYTGKRNFMKKILYYLIELILEIITSPFVDKIFVCKYDLQKRPIPFLNLIFKDKVNLIYNGVEEKVSKPKKNIYYQSNNKNILKIYTVSRLDKQKDNMSLIEVISKYDNVFLDIYGTGEDFKTLNNWINKNSKYKNITLKGFVNRDDLVEISKNYDLFCLISKWEGFPLATLEAMRASKPILVSKVGGAAEIFNNKYKCGIPISSKSPKDSIKNAINFYMKNRNLLIEHGINSKLNFLNHFTLEKCYKKHLKVWKKLGI